MKPGGTALTVMPCGPYSRARVLVNPFTADSPQHRAPADRDLRQFEQPDEFDVARPNARRHIAFGRGIHSCPGAPLARAEARVCIERLLDRTTDIRISEDKHGPADARRYSYVPTYILRGLTELHLEFDVAEETAR